MNKSRGKIIQSRIASAHLTERSRRFEALISETSSSPGSCSSRTIVFSSMEWGSFVLRLILANLIVNTIYSFVTKLVRSSLAQSAELSVTSEKTINKAR